MAYAATAVPVREPEPETEPETAPMPAARRELHLEVPCPSNTCKALVPFAFSVEADPGAHGGVFHRGPTWDHCPACGTAAAVTDCANGEHRMTELQAGGRTIRACLVCGPRYRPAPITVVGGGTA